MCAAEVKVALVGSARMRYGGAAVVIAMLVVAVVVSGPAMAAQRKLQCGSVRTNRFYHAAAGGGFGARNLTATGIACRSARRLAAAYVEDPYSVDSPKHNTRRLQGFTCTWRDDPQVSQRVTVTCTDGATQVSFGDILPSG
jgi:hypothetical protein